jgi:hypothetical protein
VRFYFLKGLPFWWMVLSEVESAPIPRGFRLAGMHYTGSSPPVSLLSPPAVILSRLLSRLRITNVTSSPRTKKRFTLHVAVRFQRRPEGPSDSPPYDAVAKPLRVQVFGTSYIDGSSYE